MNSAAQLPLSTSTLSTSWVTAHFKCRTEVPIPQCRSEMLGIGVMSLRNCGQKYRAEVLYASLGGFLVASDRGVILPILDKSTRRLNRGAPKVRCPSWTRSQPEACYSSWVIVNTNRWSAGSLGSLVINCRAASKCLPWPTVTASSLCVCVCAGRRAVRDPRRLLGSG